MATTSKKENKSGSIAAFVMKLDQVVNDPSTDNIITWRRHPDGTLIEPNALVVLDKYRFQNEVMPQYFKGAKYCSFIRQLNAYDFSNINSANPDKLHIFMNENFVKNDRAAMVKIERRKQDKRKNTKHSSAESTSSSHTSAHHAIDEDDVHEPMGLATKYYRGIQTVYDMFSLACSMGQAKHYTEFIKKFLTEEGVQLKPEDDSFTMLYHLSVLMHPETETEHENLLTSESPKFKHQQAAAPLTSMPTTTTPDVEPSHVDPSSYTPKTDAGSICTPDSEVRCESPCENSLTSTYSIFNETTNTGLAFDTFKLPMELKHELLDMTLLDSVNVDDLDSLLDLNI